LVLLAAAWWAAEVDYASVLKRNSMPLDVLSAGYKVLIVAGLIVVARRTQSRSMYLLGALVAALGIGSLIVNAQWSEDLLGGLADRVVDVLPVGRGIVQLGAMFVVLAVLAGWLVWQAYVNARPEERTAVLTIIGLLFLVGVFVGPINAISTQGYSRAWLFAEDFGQVVSLALFGSYTAGLVATRS
jgi:hypothetical protein